MVLGGNILGAPPAIRKGIVFPSSPAPGSLFYRTDLNMLCEWDGTRWLSVTEYEANSIYFGASVTTRIPIANRSDYAPYVARVSWGFLIAAPNDAVDNWTLITYGFSANRGLGALVHVQNTAGNAPTTWYLDDDVPNFSQTPIHYHFFEANVTKNNAPGSFTGVMSVWYKLIIT